MSDDLNAQIAHRLFGWRWEQHAPAYTTDPAATARVWQWLETRGAPMHRILMDYLDGEAILCTIQTGRHDVEAEGATWPEALCRAVLALAEALEETAE